MQFSMNGFRRQLSNEAKSLREIVEPIKNGEWYDEQELFDTVNAIISLSNVVNCAYSDDDPHFTDMSSIRIEHIELHTESK